VANATFSTASPSADAAQGAGHIPPGCDFRDLQPGLGTFLINQLADRDLPAAAMPYLCQIAGHLLALEAADTEAPARNAVNGILVTYMGKHWVPRNFTLTCDLLEAGAVRVRNTIYIRHCSGKIRQPLIKLA
jgi:hypothetical protein